MNEDIVPGLLAAIENDFQKSFQSDDTLKMLYAKVESGTATQADGEKFAHELGKLTAAVFHRNVRPEDLPNQRMYYNIANRIIPPTLRQNHGIVNEVMRQVIERQNREAGIGIRYQEPEFDEHKAHELAWIASRDVDYSKIRNTVETGLDTNTRMVADDCVRRNAEFQYEAGLSPKIERDTDGDCCSWCTDMAGIYEYARAPKEVFARHANCGCTVEFVPGNGKRQNVHTKDWTSETESAMMKASGESEDDRSRNKPGANVSTEVSDIIETKTFADKVAMLGESPEITAKILQEARTSLWHRSGTIFEDLTYISIDSGDVRSQRNYNVERQCIPTDKMILMIANGKPRSIIGFHNHPENSLPSKNDLVNAQRYAYGVVFCHDGTIYKYTVSDDANIRKADELLDSMQGRLAKGKDVTSIFDMLNDVGVKLEVF